MISTWQITSIGTSKCDRLLISVFKQYKKTHFRSHQLENLVGPGARLFAGLIEYLTYDLNAEFQHPMMIRIAVAK